MIALTMGMAWLLLVAAVALMPYYSGRGIAFGVAVPSQAQKSLRGTRFGYALVNLLIGGVTGTASVWDMAHNKLPTLSRAVFPFVLFLIPALMAYLLCHQRVTALKGKRGWAVTPDEHAAQGKLPSRLWHTPALCLIIATAAITACKYPALPARIALHFGGGQRWADKSVAVVTLLPMIQGLLAVGFLLLHGAVRRSDKATAYAHIHLALLWSVGAAVTTVMGLAQMTLLSVVSAGVVVWATVGLMAVTAVAGVIGMILMLEVRKK